ncbi:hypothetical protein [Pandoraea oxalativorans]|uniref:hypothetical protein n=1 Tax=Pandoraea oxalativorans TaxID=573737 RepID=UPI00069755CE|nr:hypothetical protein [Pandoraea oxalativorans]
MPEATSGTSCAPTGAQSAAPQGGASQQIALHVAAMLFGASALFGEHIAASSTMIVFGRGLFSWLALTVIALVGLAGELAGGPA